MTEFLTGMLSGSAITEAIRFIGARAIGHNDEKIRRKKDMLLEDVQALRNELDPIRTFALNYYSKPSSDGMSESTEIKRRLHAFSVSWNDINRHVKDLGLRPFTDTVLIKFRSSLTLELDVSREYSLPLNHPAVLEATKSIDAIHDELSAMRISLA